MNVLIALSLFVVPLLGCKTTSGGKGVDDDLIPLLPGGDCYYTYNPAGTAHGATFNVGFQFSGSKTTSGEDEFHKVEIGSDADTIKLGPPEGTPTSLTKGQIYTVVVTNLAGPTVQVFNKENPAEYYNVQVADIPSGDIVSPGFSVIARPYESNGYEYTMIAILEDSTGIVLHVRE